MLGIENPVSMLSGPLSLDRPSLTVVEETADLHWSSELHSPFLLTGFVTNPAMGDQVAVKFG